VICSNEAPVEGVSGSGSGSAPVIELVGGSGPHEGNIMLYGRPVCDDIATPENAQVVCRQLGYLGGQITTNSFFGRVSSVFALDDVNCNGTEEYIWRCPHETEENCNADEGMGVICSNEEPGSGSGSGSGEMCDFPMNNPSWGEYQTSIEMPVDDEAPYVIEIAFDVETTIGSCHSNCGDIDCSGLFCSLVYTGSDPLELFNVRNVNADGEDDRPIILGVTVNNKQLCGGPGGPPHCPANWTSINTECYKILIGDLNWFEAEAQCEGMDSHLVDFESKEEHEAVLEEVLKMEGIAGNNVGLWIGMSDSAEEGTWVWTSGKPVTYTAWSSGEPNNDGGREAENCAWMYAYQPSGGRLPGQWNDGRCHSGGAYSGAICKRAAVAQL